MDNKNINRRNIPYNTAEYHAKQTINHGLINCPDIKAFVGFS